MTKEQQRLQVQFRDLLEELIEKYENAQLRLIESLGSASATMAERRRLNEELDDYRRRIDRLGAVDRGVRDAA